MPILPEIQTVIDRLNRELNEIERESTEGLNLTRELLSRFPDNAILTQFFASFSSLLFFVETYRRRVAFGRAYSSERRISAGFENREEAPLDSRTSLRSVLVCSHMTLSVEFENPFSTPQCLQTPVLSRPFGASMIQWWTQFACFRLAGRSVVADRSMTPILLCQAEPGLSVSAPPSRCVEIGLSPDCLTPRFSTPEVSTVDSRPSTFF